MHDTYSSLPSFQFQDVEQLTALTRLPSSKCLKRLEHLWYYLHLNCTIVQLLKRTTAFIFSNSVPSFAPVFSPLKHMCFQNKNQYSATLSHLKTKVKIVENSSDIMPKQAGMFPLKKKRINMYRQTQLSLVFLLMAFVCVCDTRLIVLVTVKCGRD